jgi:hypothetical protein
MVSPLYNACLTFARRFSMSGIKHGAATLTTGVASLALAMAPLLLLFRLMQPKVLVNPGIGALRVAQAASWEPFLQQPPLRKSPQSAQPRHQESPARLAQDGPRHHEPKASAKHELRASNRKRSRLAQEGKTMPSQLPARRLQTRPASLAATSSHRAREGLRPPRAGRTG